MNSLNIVTGVQVAILPSVDARRAGVVASRAPAPSGAAPAPASPPAPDPWPGRGWRLSGPPPGGGLLACKVGRLRAVLSCCVVAIFMRNLLISSVYVRLSTIG